MVVVPYEARPNHNFLPLLPLAMFCLSFHVNKALQYLFRLLDIRGQGYLDSFTLSYFFRVSIV